LQEKISTWELVEIPDEYKGLIIGKGGANLLQISKQTGAEVTRKSGDVYIINGTEEQREHVKVIIALKVVGRSFL
jgi:transcription antitermination factor NusA-like protein